MVNYDNPNFETSVKKSDLIAQVKISKIHKESDDQNPYTIFEAKIESTIKGQEKSDSIIKFSIDGNRNYVFNDYPTSIFEKGRQFILFLYKPIGDYDLPLGKEVYYLVGGYTSAYQILNIDNEQVVTRRDCGLGDFKEKIDKDLVEKVKDYKAENLKKYEALGDLQAFKKDNLVELINKELAK